MILVICNNGSFSSGVIKSLSSEAYECQIFEVDKSLRLQELFLCFKATLLSLRFRAVLYISGETRCLDLMDKLNFRFPALVALLCSELSIPLLYLSSLSIYGLPQSLSYSSSFFPPSPPSDAYGRSKYLLDEYIINTLSGLASTAVLPGSIVASNSSRSMLSRFTKLVRQPLVSIILTFVCPSGSLLVAPVDDLINLILHELALLVDGSPSSNFPLFQSHRRVISSSSVPVDYLVARSLGTSPLFVLPSLPLSFFHFLAGFLPSLLVKRLCFLMVRFSVD